MNTKIINLSRKEILEKLKELFDTIPKTTNIFSFAQNLERENKIFKVLYYLRMLSKDGNINFLNEGMEISLKIVGDFQTITGYKLKVKNKRIEINFFTGEAHYSGGAIANSDHLDNCVRTLIEQELLLHSKLVENKKYAIQLIQKDDETIDAFVLAKYLGQDDRDNGAFAFEKDDLGLHPTFHDISFSDEGKMSIMIIKIDKMPSILVSK